VVQLGANLLEYSVYVAHTHLLHHLHQPANQSTNMHQTATSCTKLHQIAGISTKWEYVRLDNHAQPTYEMTPGLKRFRVFS